MSEKTEAPTGRRLAEARREGRVARSQELNAAAALLIGAWLLMGPGKTLANAMGDLVKGAVSSLPANEINLQWLRQLVVDDLAIIAPGLGIFLLVLMAAGVGTTVAQTGFLWAGKRLGFDLKRLNPLEGIRRLFSSQGLVELIRALIKLLVVGWVTYSYLRSQLVQVLGLSQTSFSAAVQSWAGLALALMLRVGGAYLILAIADYVYQRWQLMQSLRMSKQEVKEEFKQSEGDPLLRGRIRAQQRRMARMRMMSNVPKADVIITNPTHLAIALQYIPEKMQAPKVVAKGAHRTAERIVELARANDIPVMQDVPLAHALFRMVEIDQEIPPDLYLAMAEVLAYVHRLRHPHAVKEQ